MKTLALFALLFGSCPAFSQVSDLSSMRLAVLVRKDSTTAAANLAHNHGIEAHNWEAAFRYDAQKKTCSCEILVPVDALDVDSPEARKFVGLADEIDEETRESVRENMLGSDQLNAREFPTMHFISTSCTLQDNTLSLNGKFTLKGVTRPLTIEVRNFSFDTHPRGTARFAIRGSDYGLDTYSAMFGTVKNLDELTFFMKWE